MPSLADIPEHLQDRGRLLDFLDWLAKTPVPYNVKTALAHIWIKQTGRKLEKEHWNFIERHSFRNGF